MKHLTRSDISDLAQIERANLINTISGYKPANLIGTASTGGRTNLAIFSSVVHLGADPPLLGFIQRPARGIERHTYENIQETGVYTINHVHADFIERAHYTSAKFDRAVSEFDSCGLAEEYLADFAAPFVRESQIKIGLRFVEEMPIKLNDTIFMIGEIEHLLFSKDAVGDDGNVDLNRVGDVCVSGLETYLAVEELARFPYARPSELPDFKR